MGYWWFLSCDLPQFIISPCPEAGEWNIDKLQGAGEGTIQASHQRRGSTLQKWKHQLRKRLVGRKDKFKDQVPGCQSYRWPRLTTHLFSFPRAARECWATDPKGSLFCSCQNVRHPVSHICKRNLSSHADPGSVQRKSCQRSKGGNRSSNTKHFTLSKKEVLWIGNAISLSISMSKVNRSPTPTKIILKLKLTWNGQCIQMRFWFDVHFKYKKKQTGFTVNKNYNGQVRTMRFS